MEIKTNEAVKTASGLIATKPYVVATENVDVYSKEYNLFVSFYSDEEKKYDSFNIIKEKNGEIEHFNQGITIPFTDVIGVDGEEVDITIEKALRAKLIEELGKFGLTENVSRKSR